MLKKIFDYYTRIILIILISILSMIALFHINRLRIFKNDNIAIDIVVDYDLLKQYSENELTDIRDKYVSGIVFSEILLADFVDNGLISIFTGREITNTFRIQQIVNVYMWKHIKDKILIPDNYYIFINDEETFNIIHNYLNSRFNDNIKIYSDEHYVFDGQVVNNFIIELNSTLSMSNILSTPIGFQEIEIEKFRQLDFKIFFNSNNINYIQERYYDKKIFLVDDTFNTLNIDKNIRNLIAVNNIKQYQSEFLKYTVFEKTEKPNFNINSHIYYIKDTSFSNIIVKLNDLNDYNNYKLNHTYIYNIYKTKINSLIAVFISISFILVFYLIISSFYNSIKIIIFTITYLFSLMYLNNFILNYIYNLIIIQVIILLNIQYSNKKNDSIPSCLINIKNSLIIFLLITSNFVFLKFINVCSLNYYFKTTILIITNNSHKLLLISSLSAYALYFLKKYNISEKKYLSPVDLFITINFSVLIFVNYNIIGTEIINNFFFLFGFVLFLSINFYLRFINKSIEFLLYIISVLFFVNTSILYPVSYQYSIAYIILFIVFIIIPAAAITAFIYNKILLLTNKEQQLF